MKGLLIKDFKLMKNNIRYIILGGFILGVIFYLNKTGEFMIGGGFLIAYMSFVGMMTAVRTIGMDQREDSSSYLFTLPISRKTYTVEKYIFSFLVGLICFIISIIIVLIICYFRNEFDFIITLYTALVVFSFMIFMLDIVLPIQLKFGTLVSRIALVGLVFLVLFLVLSFTYAAAHGIIKSAFLDNMTYPELLLYLYIFAGLSTFISIKISEHIMKRKEF